MKRPQVFNTGSVVFSAVERVGKTAVFHGFPAADGSVFLRPQNAAKPALYLVFSRWLCYNLSRKKF